METEPTPGDRCLSRSSILAIVKMYSSPYIINKKSIAAPPRPALAEGTLNLLLPSVDCVTHNYPP